LPHTKSVVVVVDEVEVVVDVGQPPEHASQQLAQPPTVPSRAAQTAASRMTLHFVPCRAGTQQVTEPGRPHVDLLAQRLTAPRQLRGSEPFETRCFAMAAAQATYTRLGTPPQSQLASTSARAAATAAASPGSLPHLASAVRAATSTKAATTSGAAIDMMAPPSPMVGRETKATHLCMQEA
jgi:hypothetical protein